MNKNYVTRALGVEAAVEVEMHEYEVEVGRRLRAVL